MAVGEWIVYTYKVSNAELECHSYCAYDSGDEAHVPFTQEVAVAEAARINAEAAGVTAMALALEEKSPPA